MQELTQSSVVYTLTKEDLVAYNLFHVRHSPTIRKNQRNYLIKNSIAMFFIGLSLAFLPDMSLWAALGIAAFGSVFMAAYLRYYQKRGFISRLRKMVEGSVSERDLPGLLGEHTLEVDEEGITHISAYSRTRFAWCALGKIETEPGYTYLHIGTQIFIVRHQAIISGNFKGVLEQIGRHHQPDRAIAP